MQKIYYFPDQIVALEACSIPARGELRCSASMASSKKSTTVVLTIAELLRRQSLFITVLVGSLPSIFKLAGSDLTLSRRVVLQEKRVTLFEEFEWNDEWIAEEYYRRLNEA